MPKILERLMAAIAALLALATLPAGLVAMTMATKDGGDDGGDGDDGADGDDDGDGDGDDDGDDDDDGADEDADDDDAAAKKQGFKSKASKDAVLADLAKARKRAKDEKAKRVAAEKAARGKESEAEQAAREAQEKVAERARGALVRASVRAAAAEAGFIDPSDAISQISADDVDVDDETLEVDEASVEAAVKALAEKKPHLVGKRRKGKGGGDHQRGGGGSGGSGSGRSSDDDDGTAWSQQLRGKAGVSVRS